MIHQFYEKFYSLFKLEIEIKFAVQIITSSVFVFFESENQFSKLRLDDIKIDQLIDL